MMAGARSLFEGDEVLEQFATLPRFERWFVRGRLLSAPLRELAQRAPSGRIADIGCGHGLVTALLARERPDRTVVGVDPDAAKIDWARRSVGGLPNVTLRQGGIEELVQTSSGTFDAVVVADVLYLLPVERWASFLSLARSLLKPGGMLLLKEAAADGSWKHWKCLLQEVLMVRVLRRTHQSGGLGLRPEGFTRAILESSGFVGIDIVPLGKGYSTPHVLFAGRAPLDGRGEER